MLSELKWLAEDTSRGNHDSIVLFFMAHGQHGNVIVQDEPPAPVVIYLAYIMI